MLLSATLVPAQWVAFNDHAATNTTHANATRWNVFGTAGGAPGASGPLKNIANGTNLPVILTISMTGPSASSAQASAAPGSPAYALFNGFVEFRGTPYPSVELDGADSVTYTFTGLNPSNRYSFAGTAMRGDAAYTDRWTLMEIKNASSFIAAHTAHGLTSNQVPALTPSQVAINTGVNHTPATGDYARWDNIQPSASGTFSVSCGQYRGAVPGGSSAGARAYAITGIRLEDLGPSLSITSQPVSISVAPGATATFSVGAVGTGSITFQWRKDGTNVPGATNHTMTLTNISSQDVAAYSVRIGNGTIVIISDDATLALDFTPLSIVAQPTNQTLNAGSSLSIGVVLAGARPYSLQWYRNGLAVPEFINNPLETPSADERFAGNFFLIASNAFNAVTSSVATISVLFTPIAIASQPSHTALIAGSTGGLSVAVSGSVPAFQWFKNGVPIANGTNASLPFAPATTSDAAMYHVVITNVLNAVTSQVAVLNIVSPPYTLIHLTNQIWSYNQSGLDLGTAWRESSYSNATSWPQGRGVLAVEDNATVRALTNTALSLTSAQGVVVTYYFRTQVVITNDSEDISLITTNLIDDGAVVYANGVAAYRINMPIGDIFSSTLAPGASSEGVFVTNSISGELLHQGTNVIAVEVHQNSTTSSDIVMGFAAAVQMTPPSPLRITNQPQSRATDELRPVTFTLGWTGTVARVQWFKQQPGGDVAILGATSRTLEIPQPLIGVHDGDYFAVLSNIFDVVISSPATLTITQAAPTVVLQPVGRRLCPGGAVTLDTAAYGSSSNAFQWRRNGIAISNATNASYSIAASTTNDSGAYSVLVSNSLGIAISSNATVEVTLLPFFLTPPHGTGADIGGTATLAISVGGCGPFAFQWQFNGTNIDGGTNATLVHANLQLANEGLYRVIVSNASGSVASPDLPLIASLAAALNSPPIAFTIPADVWAIDGVKSHDGVASLRSLGIGSTIDASVDGPGKLTFWVSGSISFTADGLTQRATRSEGGWQLFEVWLATGSHTLSWRSSTAAAFVDEVTFNTNNFAPIILSSPQDVTVSAGTDFVLEVSADGMPPLQIQWQLNGVPVPGGSDRFLIVRDAQLAGSGLYTIIISNAYGHASANATVSILPSAPQIDAPARLLAVANRDAILNAQARGSKPMSYQWRRDGQAIPGATNAELILPRDSTDRHGAYSVAVTNSVGGSVSDIEVASTEVTKAILISLDGMAAKYLAYGLVKEPQRYPSFTKLMREGAFTLNARCDYFWAITVPNHLSMLLGRPVLQPAGQPATVHHGYLNDFTPIAGTIHTVGNTNVPYFFSVFDVVHDRGGSTAFYASKSSLEICRRSWDATNGAPDLIAPDNGRNKIDASLITSASSTLVNGWMPRLAVSPDNFTFVHLAEADTAGHTLGWGSPAWLDVVQGLDMQLGRVLSAIEFHTNAAVPTQTMILVTADHGGDGFSHLESTLTADYTIPLFAWGPGFSPGVDLHRLFANRSDPWTNYVDYNAAWQPMRNGDAGNLALAALGLPSIPGSTLTPLFPADTATLASFANAQNFTLEWSAAATAFRLESATSLTDADWAPIANGITTNANTLRYSAPADAATRFFRLKRSP